MSARLAHEERRSGHLAVSARRLAHEESGFALLAVILVMSLLAVVVTEFAFSMRLEASMVRAYRDGVLARNLAEAGIQQAIREILTDANVHGLDETGQVAFYTGAGGQHRAQASAVARANAGAARRRAPSPIASATRRGG